MPSGASQLAGAGIATSVAPRLGYINTVHAGKFRRANRLLHITRKLQCKVIVAEEINLANCGLMCSSGRGKELSSPRQVAGGLCEDLPWGQVRESNEKEGQHELTGRGPKRHFVGSRF